MFLIDPDGESSVLDAGRLATDQRGSGMDAGV
jgi:hypothetical protein